MSAGERVREPGKDSAFTREAMEEIRFTGIEGIEVGHAEDLEAATGCTVVLCREGAAAGVDVRGGAPGTRETDLLDPSNLVDRIHAVFIAGGSAFGLDAGSGIMRYLEQERVGFDVKVTRVPIVCGAVLFDLTIGNPMIRPDGEMGYQACLNARDDKDRQGNVGAGAGATVGKILGMAKAMKGGLGSHALRVGNLKVGAIAAVNALGNILDPASGEMLAGPLGEGHKSILDTETLLIEAWDRGKNLFSGNTSIAVVATNAILTKARARKVASMAHDGFARTMRPAHSMVDGDTIFTVATGFVEADVNAVGPLAAIAVERAVVSAITHARSLCGVPSRSDLHPG
jgi:L-aminopeptidase/D-esterase-like protein